MSKVISYLVPSYNHGKYLPALLESIRVDLGTLPVAAEIVIFDDGSADESGKIISEWRDCYRNSIDITAVLSAKNGGITFAFNNLIELASGKYVRFCGSDDVVKQGSTWKMLEALQANNQALCAFGDATVIDELDRKVHDSSIRYHGADPGKLSDPRTLPQELIQNWCIAGPSMLIRKSHYTTMRYDESLKIDDYDLILSLLEKPGAVRFVDESVCLYRIHGTNTSKTRDRAKRLENIRSFLTIINRYVERRTLATYLLPVKYKTIAKIHYLEKKYLKCLSNLIVSFYYKHVYRK